MGAKLALGTQGCMPDDPPAGQHWRTLCSLSTRPAEDGLQHLLRGRLHTSPDWHGHSRSIAEKTSSLRAACAAGAVGRPEEAPQEEGQEKGTSRPMRKPTARPGRAARPRPVARRSRRAVRKMQEEVEKRRIAEEAARAAEEERVARRALVLTWQTGLANLSRARVRLSAASPKDARSSYRDA